MTKIFFVLVLVAVLNGAPVEDHTTSSASSTTIGYRPLPAIISASNSTSSSDKPQQYGNRPVRDTNSQSKPASSVSQSKPASSVSQGHPVQEEHPLKQTRPAPVSTPNNGLTLSTLSGKTGPRHTRATDEDSNEKDTEDKHPLTVSHDDSSEEKSSSSSAASTPATFTRKVRDTHQENKPKVEKKPLPIRVNNAPTPPSGKQQHH